VLCRKLWSLRLLLLLLRQPWRASLATPLRLWQLAACWLTTWLSSWLRWALTAQQWQALLHQPG
jgi:hypothetical protein